MATFIFAQLLFFMSLTLKTFQEKHHFLELFQANSDLAPLGFPNGENFM